MRCAPESRRAWTAALSALALSLPVMAGCQLLGFGGAMVENYRRTSNKTVGAEYKRLEGKKWAVVVTADRVIQADYPDIVAIITGEITGRLADKDQQQKIGGAGYVPADRILRFQYENLSWPSMPRGELAHRLGVERLILVELIDYRLTEPGNQYLWAGEATGTIGVIEADGPVRDEPAFEKSIRVAFPDKQGYGPQDLPSSAVATTLVKRFVDRCAWLFYSHEEPYYPKY